MDGEPDALARKALEPDERLLWSGRPRGSARAYRYAWAVAAIWVAIAAWPVSRMVRNGVSPGAVLVLGILAVLFAVPYLRARRAYAVTDRRVLILHRLPPRTAAYALRGIWPGNVATFGHGDGTGTVRFDDFAQRCGYHDDEVCAPEFARIPDAARVATVIREASEAARGRPWYAAGRPCGAGAGSETG